MKKVCDSMELEDKLLCRYDEEETMKALDVKMKGKEADYLLGLIVDELPADLAVLLMKRYHKTND